MRPTLVDRPHGADHSVSFVAPAALDDGLADRLGLRRRLVGVTPTRDVGKADMVNNDALPDIEVDPETFAITVDGELHRARAGRPTALCPALLDVLSGRRSRRARSSCCSPMRGCPSPGTRSRGASSRRCGWAAARRRAGLHRDPAVARSPGSRPRPPWSPCTTCARVARLEEVETAWAARTPSPAMRRHLARAGSRPAAACRPAVARRTRRSPQCAARLRSRARWSLAAVARRLRSSSPLPLARLVGYDDVQTVASAALKLLPLDPAEVAGWVLRRAARDRRPSQPRSRT